MGFRQSLSVRAALRRWWSEGASRDGYWPTRQKLATALWEFLRESTPARRRQRYGDADYDWDYRVDTTSATVTWRERLLGHFHSPYQPTEPGLFKEIMGNLAIDFRAFAFIDIGSGKGRVLLMAADYPFRRVLGVELMPDLHRIAEQNIVRYKSDSQQCFSPEAIHLDAREFIFPADEMVIYLFNPLPEPALLELLAHLEGSLRENPRTAYVLYHNPLLERVLAGRSAFRKIAGTHQYSVFLAVSAPHSRSAEI